MTITAKYSGTCRRCGGSIAVGDTIDWERDQGATHTECPATQPQSQEDAPYRIGGGSGYGCDGWTEGQTIAQPTASLYADYPAHLTVVRAGRRYHRDEGMSFGVGDERGYTYWAECREATAAEASSLIQARDEATARRAASWRLCEITDMIRSEGELPGGDNTPTGDVLLDTQDIHGGGSWYVIGPEHLWYVANNGRDGDNWSRNNVVTGGAGAVGWRIPVTPALANELRSLAAIL
jgi:hypothetical protein